MGVYEEGVRLAFSVAAATIVGLISYDQGMYAGRVEALCRSGSYQGSDAPDSIPPGSAGDVIRDVTRAARNGCRHNQFDWK